MQNSLDRILEGLARSLATDVAPHVDDPYAKAQVMAAVELVNNLATRVEWRREPLLADIEAARQVLSAAGADVAPVDPAASGTELAAVRRGHLVAVAALQGTDVARRPEVASVLGDFLRSTLDRELELLRTGMYSRRPKEGEKGEGREGGRDGADGDGG